MSLIPINRREELPLGILLKATGDVDERQWGLSAEQIQLLAPLRLELTLTNGSLKTDLYHEVYNGNDLTLNIQWDSVMFHNAFSPAHLVSRDYQGRVSRALGTILVDGEVYEPLNEDSTVEFSASETLRMVWKGSAVHNHTSDRVIQFHFGMFVQFVFDWQLEIISDGDTYIESPEIAEDLLQLIDVNLDQMDEATSIVTLFDCGTEDKITCYRGTGVDSGDPIFFVEAVFGASNETTRVTQKGSTSKALIRVLCDEKRMMVTPGQMLTIDEVKKLFRSFYHFKVVVDPNCTTEPVVGPDDDTGQEDSKIGVLEAIQATVPESMQEE